MKINTLILSLGVLLFVSCTNNSGETTEKRKLDFAEMLDNPTAMEFEEMDYDFGTVTDGDLVNKVFKFKNTGDTELVLFSVKGSCGCTVPEDWPKHPIAPGNSGEIKVTFNSAGRVGDVRKSVTIEANTMPTVTVLNITGKVVEVK